MIAFLKPIISEWLASQQRRTGPILGACIKDHNPVPLFQAAPDLSSLDFSPKYQPVLPLISHRILPHLPHAAEIQTSPLSLKSSDLKWHYVKHMKWIYQHQSFSTFFKYKRDPYLQSPSFPLMLSLEERLCIYPGRILSTLLVVSSFYWSFIIFSVFPSPAFSS